MNTTKRAQDAISKAKLAVKFSEQTIAKQKKELDLLEDRLKKIKGENSARQTTANQAIIKKVQLLDEETLKFIKSTE